MYPNDQLGNQNILTFYNREMIKITDETTIFEDFYAALPPSYKLSGAVIWSFVKIENGCVKTGTIYIVSNDRISEIENDQMTMTK